MFERFTASARGTVVRAQEEAVDAGDGFIGTEHVVLALAQDAGVAGEVLRDAGVSARELRRRLREREGGDDAGLDASALATIGIDLDDVRRSIEETFGEGALDATPSRRARRRWGRGDHIPFTRRAKKCLERGLRQAIMLGDTRIGSEHLLLGVLDEGNGVGVRLLRDQGVDLIQLWATTVERSRRSA